MEAAGMSGYGKAKYPKPKRPKTKLGLPDLDHSKSAVLDSLRSTSPACEFKSRLPQVASSALFSTLHLHLVTLNEGTNS
jgi:hypothetical protein